MTPQEGINGLRKRILRRGLSTFGAPPPKATVTVHYTMFFENQDEPFDSSELRGRAERYKLDDGRFIPGFEAAVKSMEKDEEAEFLIAPEFSLSAGIRGHGVPSSYPGKRNRLCPGQARQLHCRRRGRESPRNGLGSARKGQRI